jgi:hypothetical protein
MKSNKYLLTYCYENSDHTLGVGSVTMTQSKYTPIDQEVIDDAIAWVRNDINLPDSQKIIPLAFMRFEPKEET